MGRDNKTDKHRKHCKQHTGKENTKGTKPELQVERKTNKYKQN